MLQAETVNSLIRIFDVSVGLDTSAEALGRRRGEEGLETKMRCGCTRSRAGFASAMRRKKNECFDVPRSLTRVT